MFNIDDPGDTIKYTRLFYQPTIFYFQRYTRTEIVGYYQ